MIAMQFLSAALSMLTPLKPVPPIVTAARAESMRRLKREARIMQGNGSNADLRESHREMCAERLMDEAISLIADQLTVTIEEEGTTGEHFGTPCEDNWRTATVDEATFEIELQGLELRGWYMERRYAFTGERDGAEWTATVIGKRVMGRGKRRVLGLMMKVEDGEGTVPVGPAGMPGMMAGMGNQTRKLLTEGR